MVLTPWIGRHRHHLGDPVNSGRGLSVLVQPGLTNVCTTAVISSCPARLGCFMSDTFLFDGCSIIPGVPGFRWTKAHWNGVTSGVWDLFLSNKFNFWDVLKSYKSDWTMNSDNMWMHYNNVHMSYILKYYHGYISHSSYFSFVNYST